MNPEQVQPRTVIIANANDWNKNFAYDLDPGIVDRIKVISTLREDEVRKKSEFLYGTLSEGSPDLRPYSHIPYLAEKLGVSQDAIYLWCLRLATDRFWEVISDNSDPMVNRLQVEVRYWTSRQRIKFKSDVIQAVVNSMAFSYALRHNPEENNFMNELDPYNLFSYLDAFYFVGVDPCCQPLTVLMKEKWEEAGRPSTHFYQGFREVRWRSVKAAIMLGKKALFDEHTQEPLATQAGSSLKTIKEMFETMDLRDGFKMGGEAGYVIENWDHCRYSASELVKEAKELLEKMDPKDRARLSNLKQSPKDGWMLSRNYSPDKAEHPRLQEWEKLHKVMEKEEGVKV